MTLNSCMTHSPETGAGKMELISGVSFWSMCHGYYSAHHTPDATKQLTASRHTFLFIYYYYCYNNFIYYLSARSCPPSRSKANVLSSASGLWPSTTTTGSPWKSRRFSRCRSHSSELSKLCWTWPRLDLELYTQKQPAVSHTQKYHFQFPFHIVSVLIYTHNSTIFSR